MAKTLKLAENPYLGRGPRYRARAEAWEEGYTAGRNDDPCPGPVRSKDNPGRHCEHWREGDGPCCGCNKPGTIVNDVLLLDQAANPDQAADVTEVRDGCKFFIGYTVSDGGHYQFTVEAFKTYLDGLTPAEDAALKAKGKWERISRSKAAIVYGAPVGGRA
jgi:hypothetical protein